MSETDDRWTFTTLGTGTKPALAVASDGTIHAAFLQEATAGWVGYARLDAGGSTGVTETVATGYFYGPIDIWSSPGLVDTPRLR